MRGLTNSPMEVTHRSAVTMIKTDSTWGPPPWKPAWVQPRSIVKLYRRWSCCVCGCLKRASFCDTSCTGSWFLVHLGEPPAVLIAVHPRSFIHFLDELVEQHVGSLCDNLYASSCAKRPDLIIAMDMHVSSRGHHVLSLCLLPVSSMGSIHCINLPMALIEKQAMSAGV